MKYIRKGTCPHAYTNWCAAVCGTGDEDFRKVPRVEKAALLSALLAEQGAICAYTMQRIAEQTSHVEHLKPYSVCRAEGAGTDLDYRNLVACFPRDGMKKRYRYGAHQKGDWWDHGGADFVSPLHPSSEKRFRFDLDGRIAAVGGNRAAQTTIRVLALDHPSLTDERRRAIREFVYGADGQSPLSPAKAERANRAICDRDARANFHVFCVAIRDALAEFAKVLEKMARLRKAMRLRGMRRR